MHKIGVMPRRCDRYTCPLCAVEKIAETVAPAWAYWRAHGGAIAKVVHRRGRDTHRERDGLKIRGVNATPAVIIIRLGDDDEVVFAPKDSGLDGSVVPLDMLDSEIVRYIRAAQIPESTVRRHNEAQQIVPSKVGDSDLNRALEAEGIALIYSGRHVNATAEPEDYEQVKWRVRNHIFVRLDPNVPAYDGEPQDNQTQDQTRTEEPTMLETPELTALYQRALTTNTAQDWNEFAYRLWGAGINLELSYITRAENDGYTLVNATPLRDDAEPAFIPTAEYHARLQLETESRPVAANELRPVIVVPDYLLDPEDRDRDGLRHVFHSAGKPTLQSVTGSVIEDKAD